MFILGNFFMALARIVDFMLGILTWLIIFRAIISWVNPDPFNPIVQFLNRTTEPILQPIRRFLPRTPIDLSPIIAFVLILFLQTFLVETLRDIGYYMRRSQSSETIQVEPPSTKQEDFILK